MRQRQGKPHRLVSSFSMLAIVASLMVAGAPASQAVNVAQGAIVNPNPDDWTPNVLDGQINSIVQIGNEIYAAGKFTQVQAASGGTIYARTNIFAFNATTGAIDTTFAPTLDDMVRALAVSPDGNLFVAGNFSSVNGDTTVKKLVKLNPTNGQRITAFSANANGQVWDIVVSGSRLIVGGRFTAIKNVARDRLAALNTTTGAVDANVSFAITDPHTSTSVPWVYSLDVSPDGSKLVIIGNFMKVDGQDRPQAALIDLTPTSASLANWETDRYAPACFSWAFDTYMRDVGFSPDGSYFVIGVTGGGVTGTLCDSTARWETNAQGAGLQPTWVDVTGGDTISAVAVTGSVVYTGGHNRWQNNYYGIDFPGPGAVDRPGLAALDPVNGLPFSWNPTRDRGGGVLRPVLHERGPLDGERHRQGDTGGELTRSSFLPTGRGRDAAPDRPLHAARRPLQRSDHFLQWRGPVHCSRVERGRSAVPSSTAVQIGSRMTRTARPAPPIGTPAAMRVLQPAVHGGQHGPVDDAECDVQHERWDPGDPPEMQWNFPVASGTHLQVRLYLINQCDARRVWERVFNVASTGTPSSTLRHRRRRRRSVGTMRAFNITSDGTVNIDFSHLTENTLINGIEIVNTDIPPTPAPGAINFLPRRAFNGTTLGSPSNLNTPRTDWSTTRGSSPCRGCSTVGRTTGTSMRKRSTEPTSGLPSRSTSTG